jgi:hypothetical protein
MIGILFHLPPALGQNCDWSVYFKEPSWKLQQKMLFSLVFVMLNGNTVI